MAKIPTSYALDEPGISAGRNVIAFDRQDRINLEQPGRDTAKLGQSIATAGNAVFGAIKAQQDEADDYEITKTLIGFQREAERQLDADKHAMAPGGDGFADTYKTNYDDIARRTFADFKGRGYGEGSLKRLDSKMLEWSEKFYTRAYHEELQERDRFHIEDVQKQILDTEGRVQEQPERVGEHIAASRALIQASRIAPGKKDALMRRVPAQLEEIAARTLIERDPEAALKSLQRRPKAEFGANDNADAPKSPGGQESTVDFIKKEEGSGDNGWDVRQFSGPYGVKRGEKEKLTLEQADKRLREEVAPIENWVDSTIKAPLSPEQRTAVVSLFYNIGMDKGRPEQLAKLVNGGEMDKVADWIRQYSFDRNGKKVPGLADRREREATLWESGVGKAPVDKVERKDLPDVGAGDGGQKPGGPDAEPQPAYEYSDEATFRHLPFAARSKLINVARTSMRNQIMTETANDLELIRQGKEPVLKDGRSAIERASQILTKNQQAKLTEQVEEAKLEARIVQPLRRMNQEQALEHITKNIPDAAEESDTFKRNVRVMEKADRAWKRIEEGRKRDLAMTLEREPEIIEARKNIAAASAGGMSPRDANTALVEARIALQDKIGIPKYEQKLITRQEASKLLEIGDPKSMTDDQVEKALRTASERAVATYGPKYGTFAFRQAVAYKLGGGAHAEAASDVLARTLRGQPISDEDRRKLRAAKDLDSVGAVNTVREQYGPPASLAPKPTSSWWPFGGGSTAPAPSAPAAQPAPKTGPNAAHVQWLMADPGSRTKQFDDKFGAGAAAAALKNTSP